MAWKKEQQLADQETFGFQRYRRRSEMPIFSLSHQSRFSSTECRRCLRFAYMPQEDSCTSPPHWTDSDSSNANVVGIYGSDLKMMTTVLSNLF